MSVNIRSTWQVLREIAVLVQAGRCGHDEETQRAMFAALSHVLNDGHRRRETVQATMSDTDHRLALSVAEQHRYRFTGAYTALMNAPVDV